MYVNLNEYMVFKLVVSLEQGGRNKPPGKHTQILRLGLICFKTFHLNLKESINFKPITYICCSLDTWYK